MVKDPEEKNVKLAAYLCFRGPLVPLLLLTSTVCAVWNELSIYKLEE